MEALGGNRQAGLYKEVRVGSEDIREKRGGREMKEECYRALRAVLEDWLGNLYKERRKTRDLGERDRITGKIEELQRILEGLKEKEEKK
ncbi:MAG: hypothetical protein NUV68_04560 [Caldiserica bacterium]|nr:hypothetical protein [Caldisericota bacterium]MDH7563246.1 hypothetical protein [Caldisericota bacterium]